MSTNREENIYLTIICVMNWSNNVKKKRGLSEILIFWNFQIYIDYISNMLFHIIHIYSYYA